MSNQLFKVFFFPSTLNDWFKLDENIRNSESIAIFKSRLLSFIRTVQSNIYHIFDPKGLKFLTRLRLGLSHLNEHKFRHNFMETEDSSHYFLHCQHLFNHRIDLKNSVKSVIINFESMTDNRKRDILLYGDSRFDENKNEIILEATLNCLKNSERFSGSLFE